MKIFRLFVAFTLICFALSQRRKASCRRPPEAIPTSPLRGGPRPSGSHLGRWEHSNWYVFVV